MAPLAILGALLLTIQLTSGPDDPAPEAPTTTTTSAPPTEDDLANSQLVAAFVAAGNSTIEIAKVQLEWREGVVDDEAMRSRLLASFPDLIGARDAVVALAAGASEGSATYAFAAQLLVEWVRVHLTVLDIPRGPTRDQVDLSARRVKLLADHVYDQGAALLVGLGLPVDDVEVRLPDDVPDWVSFAIAPGPPLVPTGADGPPSTPADRPTTRPTISLEDWEGRVSELGLPDGPALGAALAGGSRSDLVTLAEALTDAAATLHRAPDPEVDDGRARSAIASLSLLSSTEAAWLSGMATLDVDAAVAVRLQASATRLALIGDGLWSLFESPRAAVADDGQLVDAAP